MRLKYFLDTSPNALTPSPSPIRWARVAQDSPPFEAERGKLIKREDGFGYQDLTEFAKKFYAS